MLVHRKQDAGPQLSTVEKLVHRKQDASPQRSVVEKLSHAVGEVGGFLGWDHFLF